MASEHDISQVWHGMLDAERLSRYYGAMAVRLQRWHMGLTAFVAIGSTAAVGSLLLNAPDVVAEIFASVGAAAAAWSWCYGHASKAAVMEAAQSRCSDLVLSWRNLWTQLESLDEAAVLGQIQRLQKQQLEATTHVPAHLAAKRRLNEQCAEEAYAVMGNEYAAAH